jgi:hypothetical protein
LHAGFVVSSSAGWWFFGSFCLYIKITAGFCVFGPKKERKTIKEVLVSSGTYLKNQNQRTTGFQLFQTPQRTARFHERTGSEPIVF